ncbi:MAG TPA: hypothetical protein VM934_13900 [Pyrinomonadaceae bacterium]|jgi:hypothetical protein|nr:hypothetical protein [Pyrinomonadaceae bacterium]
MLRIKQRQFNSPLLALPLSGLLLASLAATSQARAVAAQQQNNTNAASVKVKTDASAAGEEQPPYQEYKGVRIGMSADEARKKLGRPTDKGDQQDVYVFNDNESAQIYYDGSKTVFAVSVMYTGQGIVVPTAKAVVGSDVEARPDGSMHKMVSYPKAGFWVSYNRTAGDSPLTIITMQKKQ